MARLVTTAALLLLGVSASGPHGPVPDPSGADHRVEPLLAQLDPVGPCSPYRAEDGDIPSELPGCARHRRLLPGSLADELQFRRGRPRADEDAAPDTSVTDAGSRRPKRRTPLRRGASPDDD